MKKILAGLSAVIVAGTGIVVEGSEDVVGSLSPTGAPVGAPVRIEAGRACVVDLTQRYTVAGGLSGQMEIDYRILVHGPCGSPAGTFDEEWIAHGTFAGTLVSDPVSGTFVYTAEVRGGGEIRGRMVFGDGLDGELALRGRFSDETVSYAGSVKRGSGVRSR